MNITSRVIELIFEPLRDKITETKEIQFYYNSTCKKPYQWVDYRKDNTCDPFKNPSFESIDDLATFFTGYFSAEFYTLKH